MIYNHVRLQHIHFQYPRESRSTTNTMKKIPVTFVTLKRITLQVHAYFHREAARGCLYRSIFDPLKRTKDIIGISGRSLKRWVSEEKDRPLSPRSPKKKCPHFDSFDKDVIKREIEAMFREGSAVTLRRLRASLEERRDIEISKTSLWRLVRSFGFTFRKINNGKNVLCERPDVVSARSRYLRDIRQRREEGYAIVYIDETWVNAHHTFSKEWQSTDGSCRCHVPSGKGERLILAHAGCRSKGLLEDGELLFRSHSTDGRDYHTEMNGVVFSNWLLKTVIPSLDRPSCLVMDNASYHNIVDGEDKTPTASTTK